MVPSNFAESNYVLDPPPGVDLDDCSVLSVWRGPTDMGSLVISCWKLTEEERQHLLAGGRLWLYVWGQSMPPVALETTNPFTRQCDA